MEEAKQKEKINYMAYLEKLFPDLERRNNFIAYCIIKFGLRADCIRELFETDYETLSKNLILSCSNQLSNSAIFKLTYSKENREKSMKMFDEFIRQLIIACYRQNKNLVEELLNDVSNKKLEGTIFKYRLEGVYPLDSEKVKNILLYRKLYAYSFKSLGIFFHANGSLLRKKIHEYLDKMIEDNPEDESLVELRDDSYALDEFFKYYGAKNRPRLNR